jgi:hypothetical protein
MKGFPYVRTCLVKIFMIKSRGDFHFLTLSEVDQFMYPSDLTDAEWKRIAHHFQPKDRRGSGCKMERTFAWLGGFRRLANVYDFLPDSF